MLTKRHRAIIRAALLFFDEEMSPHGPDVSKHYFDEPLKGELKAEEVGLLRELLRTTELRYLRCAETGPMVPSQELLTFEQVQETPNLFGRLATVLLISRS